MAATYSAGGGWTAAAACGAALPAAVSLLGCAAVTDVRAHTVGSAQLQHPGSQALPWPCGIALDPSPAAPHQQWLQYTASIY